VAVLKARAEDLVTEEELAHKLMAAQRAGRALRVKYGAGSSAPDIHLGRVVGLKKLREFQDQGHAVGFIIGDFTGMRRPAGGMRNFTRVFSERQLPEDIREVEVRSEYLSGGRMKGLTDSASPRVRLSENLRREAVA